MKPVKRMRFLLIISVGLILAVLACNAPAATAGDGGSVTQTPEPAEGVDAAAPTAEGGEAPTPTEVPVDPASVCPEPTADTQLYVDEVNGFCLLYPASFTVHADPDTPSFYTDVQFVGGVVAEGGMESVSATLQVNVIAQPGAAAGFTAAEYTDQVAFDQSLVLDSITREEVTVVGDLPAVMLKNQPGMLPSRSLYVNAHNTLYEITAVPDSGPDGAPVPDVELAWTTMLESLTFFPPTFAGEVITPDQVCPTATADTYLFINRRDGYCVLVPNSFEEDSNYGRGWFVGGPELTGLPESMEPRVSAAIGMQGPTEETVGQIADRHIDAVPDAASVIRTDTTVSGYPAVFWDRPQGIVPSRSALIVVNGYLYTLVVQPIDPVRYPEAVEPAELVWNTFIDSFAFFEPWQ
jgi:hypothetical protein